MKRKKRLVAMLLSLLMVFSICTSATYAEEDTVSANSTVVETVDENSDDETGEAVNDTNVLASEETDVIDDETTETDVVTNTEEVTTNVITSTVQTTDTSASDEVQVLIDALPAVDELSTFSTDELNDVYTNLQYANDAYEALSSDKQSLIDDSKLDGLFNYFNSLTMETADEETSIIAIYLDGVSGDNENDCSSADLAVYSFDKALELAKENDVSTIYVTGTVTITSGDVTWDEDENDISLVRDNSLKSSPLIELNGGNLTLSNITIDGGNISSTSSLIRVNNANSTLTITEGTVIQNNINTSTSLASTDANNAAVCVVNGNLVMTGGEIKNNKGNSWGGGIALIANGSTLSATMSFSGGTISGNKSTNGGGIYLYGNSTLNMSSGTVTENSASSFGGGIYVGCGSIATISAGYITDNTCTGTNWGGGGIYVNSAQAGYDNGKLYLYNAEIAENSNTSETAAESGFDSTISCCQTGIVEVNVTDGAVIHDNDTRNTIQVYQNSSAATFVLSPIMLGGGAYNWTDYYGNILDVDNLTFTNAGWVYANIDVSTETGAATGLTRIKTYITDNQSFYLGAAIGTNGEVYIGKSDGDVTLDINKVWDDSVKEKAESIEVEVYATSKNDGTTTIGTVSLSDDNSWQVSISNLPKYDTDGNEYTYQIKEVGNDYFNEIETTVKSSGSVYDEDEDKTASYSFTITNKELSILTLEKNVEGTTINDKFVFEVTLKSDNELYTGNIKAILNDTDETLIEFVDGIGNVELGADDSIDLYLEKGMTYTIRETDNKGALDTTVKINNVSQDNTSVSETINEDTIVSYTNNYGTTGLLVSKVWSDANDQDGIRPDEITVVLVKNGEATDQTVILNADNNWSTSFTNLPKYSNGIAIEYTVEEVSVNGYTSVVTGSMSEGLVITNTHTPITPTNPTPDDPTTPTTPTTSTETTPSTSSTKTSTNDATTETVETNVKTGDNTNIALNALILIIAMFGIVTIRRTYKKKQ